MQKKYPRDAALDVTILPITATKVSYGIHKLSSDFRIREYFHAHLGRNAEMNPAGLILTHWRWRDFKTSCFKHILLLMQRTGLSPIPATQRPISLGF